MAEMKLWLLLLQLIQIIVISAKRVDSNSNSLNDYLPNEINVTALVRIRRSARSRNAYGSSSSSSDEDTTSYNYGVPEPVAISRKHSARRGERSSRHRSRSGGNAYVDTSLSRDELPGLIHKQVITGIPDLSDPCFRRYSNSIIINAQPYERRSSISLTNCKSQCLRSQVGTYSCRSFIYDNVNQVCDLFAHVGDQSPARLLRFQSRDYFEPTAAISCQPPATAVNGELFGPPSRQPASNTFGATIHDGSGVPTLSPDRPQSTNAREDSNAASLAEISDEGTAAAVRSNSAASFVEGAGGGASCDATQLPRFLKTVDFELYAHDDTRVSKVSADECLDLCASNLATKAPFPNRALKCNSFEYDNHREECVLSMETAVPLGNGQLKQRTGTDYYEKLCVDEKLALDCGTQIYARYPQMILVGFAETVVDAPTLQHCFDNCLNSRRLYGFRCISGMFYFEEPQLNCILNTEDRMTQPDLFTVENSDLVDYFETLCKKDSDSSKNAAVAKSTPAQSRHFSTAAVTIHKLPDAKHDFVDLPANQQQPESENQDQNVLTVPVSTSIDALPGVRLSTGTSAIESGATSWSAWADCETSADAQPSAGVNGALTVRGTQTRRRLCTATERVCARETRQCEVDVSLQHAARPQKLARAYGTEQQSLSSEKMAEALNRAQCADGECCAVFGGCRVGVRRVSHSQSGGQLEWCINPCDGTS